jgi:hypothetical protein
VQIKKNEISDKIHKIEGNVNVLGSVSHPL